MRALRSWAVPLALVLACAAVTSHAQGKGGGGGGGGGGSDETSRLIGTAWLEHCTASGQRNTQQARPAPGRLSKVIVLLSFVQRSVLV